MIDVGELHECKVHDAPILRFSLFKGQQRGTGVRRAL